MKSCLKRTIGNTILTYEGFSTVLAQIEASLNSRSLQPFTEDVEDFTALTPGHFLIGSEILAAPSENLLSTNPNLLIKWKHAQKLNEHFWNRWLKEYLSTQRNKWKRESENLKVGDMVLLMEENLPPTSWKLARIKEVHPGADGYVRVATVKTASGEMKRAITKLCLLPFTDYNE